MDNWWQTPSLSRFIGQLVESLWRGQIVLLFTPKRVPSDFIQEFKARCRTNDISDFETLDFGQNSSNPLDVIYDHFSLGELETYVPKNIHDVFGHIPASISTLLIFKGLKLEEAEKKGFTEFMGHLSHYYRTSEHDAHEHKHKLLVLIENGQLFPDDFSPEPNFERKVFSQLANPLTQHNGLCYYLNIENGNVMSELHEQLIISLARFDLELTEQLVQANSLLLDKYEEILNDYANDRSWGDVQFVPASQLTSNDKWQRWSEGIIDFDGEGVIYNSAYLQMHGQTNVIKRRMWVAMVRTIFPVIEEVRHELVSSEILDFKNEAFLINRDNPINNRSDFEIGQIAYCAKRNYIHVNCLDRLRRKRIFELIKLSADIRNNIAHLDIPKKEKLELLIQEANDLPEILI